MIVPVVKKTSNELPEYATPGSAGLDLRAELSKINETLLFYSHAIKNRDGSIDYITIEPGGRALIPTGLHIQLPEGYEARIQPRSGLALKKGISIVNSPGCVDSDYVGDVGIILINHGNESFRVYQGDRIAQMIISKVEQITWKEVELLEETERGDGGFGHTSTN